MFGVNIDNAIRFQLYCYQGSFRCRMGTQSNNANLALSANNNRILHTLSMDGTTATYTMRNIATGESQEISYPLVTTATSAYSLYLFSSRTAKDNSTPGIICSADCYGYKLYDGARLVQNCVPARRLSDNAVGLLDLANGNTFYANKGTGTFTAGNAVGILRGSSESGELHLCADTDVVNESVRLSGGLKLVKEGPGTFTAVKPEQTYVGGTVVAAGTATTLLSGSEGSTYAAKYYQWGLAGTTIVIEPDATFDTKGNYDYNAYSFELAGGTFANTGCNMSKTAADGWGGNGSMQLTTNSTYQVNFVTRHTRGVLDLGGHTLTMPIADAKYFILDGTSVFANGAVDITSGGWLRVLASDKDMRTVDFTLHCALSVQTNMYVRNLTMRYEGNYAEGNGQVRIGGVFTPSPTKNYARNFVLQDGAVLNLAEQSAPWWQKSSLSKCTPVAFADNAVIGIKVGERSLHNHERLVAWTTGAGPNASFKLLGNLGFRLLVEEDGIYCDSNGTLILLR